MMMKKGQGCSDSEFEEGGTSSDSGSSSGEVDQKGEVAGVFEPVLWGRRGARKRHSTYQRWTEEDDNKMFQLLGRCSVSDLKKAFPTRCVEVLRRRRKERRMCLQYKNETPPLMGGD